MYTKGYYTNLNVLTLRDILKVKTMYLTLNHFIHVLKHFPNYFCEFLKTNKSLKKQKWI